MGIDENAAFGDYGPPSEPRKEEKKLLYTPLPKLAGVLPIFILSIFFVSLTDFSSNTIFLGATFLILYSFYLKIINMIRNTHIRTEVEKGLSSFYKNQQ